MKKILMMMLMFVMGLVLFAADNEIVVDVSVPGQKVSGKVQKELKSAANKLAVKKYLKTQNEKIEEKVLDEAAADAEKYVNGDPDEEEEPSAEDGEVKAKYKVTIKQEEIAQFLQARGLSANVAADGSKLEIFVMEEVPDAGQMQLGDDVGNFFFTRYNMFQRRIRDALVKKVNAFGFEVILLEDNENYEEMKKKDPVLVGVSYDVNKDTRGFTKTPDFLRTVQENNPDAIALYYRIDALAYDADKGVIRTTVALSFKNLAANTTQNIGSRDFEFRTSNTKPDMLMADFGTAVERAMFALLNGEGMGAKLSHMVTSMRAASKRPKGPMKVVINCSKVDSKIKIKVRNGLKKQLVAAGLTDQTKVVKDSLSCVVKPSKDFGDLDDVWGKISEILPEFLGEDIEITDDWAKKNGDTLTVTIGK